MSPPAPVTHWQTALAVHWPVDGTLQRLHGEYDLNLASDTLVYKVMRPGLTREDIAPQLACHRHAAAAGLKVPTPIPAAGGALSQVVEDEGGQPRTVWALSRLDGTPLARVRPWTPPLAREIGEQIARLHDALASFDHPGVPKTHEWDIRALPSRAAQSAQLLATHPLATTLQRILREHTGPACGALATLPQQPIHNDLNEHNVLVRAARCGESTVTGLIDFGDMLRAPAIVDLAIAAAYLAIGDGRPWPCLRALIAGYCAHRSLSERERELLWPLLLSRLAQSAINAWLASEGGRDDPYLQISQRSVARFLQTHAEEDPAFVQALVARASGACSRAEDLTAWLSRGVDRLAPVFATPLADAPVLDLAVTGDHACDNPVRPDLAQIGRAVAQLAEGGAALGRYAEPRLIYGAPFFLSGTHGASDRRTVHIAIDVFLPAGTPVCSPLAATVHSAEICDAEYDYGGLITLRHTDAQGVPFFTLYGHLAHASVRALTAGQAVAAGQAFAVLGGPAENGGWPPHVHLQLGLTDLPGSRWPGVVDPDDAPDWQAVFPDPSVLLGVPPGRATYQAPADEDLMAQRRAHSPPSLRTSYRDPLTIVRGWRSLLFDRQGRSYLDAYNNVPHVGHAHPRVRAAIDRQLRWVNTNTRYLQPIHGEYTTALAARMPAELDVVFLLSSGSEANELALRLARSATGRKHALVMQAGYHGHTVAAIDISDYKFSGPGGEGAPDWVHVVPNPDAFRAGLQADDRATGEHFAADVDARIEALVQADQAPGCFIAETFPSVGGQLIPPPGYLEGVYRAVRAAGGLCIADEVQTGLGRLGRYFWGFEQQQVVPDIVVLGKPLGNGYPLAAVVTRREIAERFDTGMEFFATFGGSSVACAAGLSVLRIIDEEALSDRAQAVGTRLLTGLRELATRHPLLADVRGLGLFIGVEIADAQRRPLPEEAAWIVEGLRQQRVLIGRDGPHYNVLKIRPPLSFCDADADHLLSRLDGVLHSSALQLSLGGSKRRETC